MATAFEHLNRSLDTFVTSHNERSEKSNRLFKKPRCYKDEFCRNLDRIYEDFEEEDLTERQEGSAVTSNLEGQP